MSPVRARVRSARYGDERTAHEATVPPLIKSVLLTNHSKLKQRKGLNRMKKYESVPSAQSDFDYLKLAPDLLKEATFI